MAAMGATIDDQLAYFTVFPCWIAGATYICAMLIYGSNAPSLNSSKTGMMAGDLDVWIFVQNVHRTYFRTRFGRLHQAVLIVVVIFAAVNAAIWVVTPTA